MAADSFLMPPCRKIRIREAKEPNPNRCDSSGVEESQDADYPYVPQLSDDIEKSILARFPRSRILTSCIEWQLPELPSRDVCCIGGDKESLCAGSHLIVSGRDYTECNVVWRFELETSKWFKGHSMIDLQCLFASATCGTFGFVAGGIEMGLLGAEVLNSTEKYNPETKSWESC
ncbi:hypothetical protein F3Y22_tig00004041pilonHSYRG00075 [Hibiscus syriacus]|uniref:F-box/kelch-repeat protein n=1 Tax=Hibiscus syriacus TaxID=106335 RepID=A0A6A3CHP4_HIBSY|nr:hypothetical protein F3Y22_tig00004041pilonHSYRG00075 [Hibiscus syriacus]